MRKVKLGKLADVIVSGVDKKTKEGEIPVKLCNFVDVYYNWAITSEMHGSFMDASARDAEIDKFTLSKGQVAITKDSETRYDIGIPSYIADDFDDDVLLGYHCALITPKPELLCGKYLNALLHSDYAKDYFANNATGSGQRYTISEDTIKAFPVPMISLEEQTKIGNYLSEIDRKIANNRKQNDLLEKMAKQLYDYWFVQFDFPDENGRPYKSSGGKMIYNDTLKREIPEGWKTSPIFDVLDITYGYPFSTDSFVEYETDKPLIRIRDILDGTISAYSTENVDEKYCLNKGDVVVGMDGNFHMNFWHDDRTYLNQRCVRLRPKLGSPISSIQILYSIKPYIKAKEATVKGSTVGHLSDKDLKELVILEPTNKVLRKTLDSFLEKILQNRNEIIKLTNLRNYIMPLLMNGQAKISV